MPYCPECSAAVPVAAKVCPTCGASLVTTPTAAGPEAVGAPALDSEALRADLAASLAPTYELLKPLGEGGMGMVFLAREPALKRLVAVKLLAPYLAGDSRSRARFEREARAAAALSHPNVVRVYSVGETVGQKLPYIVMQHVEGPTLAAWLAGRGRAGERDARRIVGEVAAALAAAHARGLVHRDVKPSNVLVEAESGRAYVVDFGVSAALARDATAETKLTGTGMVIGTPVYMSPEQAAGDEVTPKSDVYSLGVLAYEVLTGELPFSATTAMGWAAAHLRDTPTPVAKHRLDLSPEVALLVDRCLSKTPAARPPADEVARGMLPSLAAEIEWPPPGLHDLAGRGRTLARLGMAVAALGLMAVFALSFTPRILLVHPGWLAQFTMPPEAGTATSQARLVSPETEGVTAFVWQTFLIVGVAGFVTGSLLLVVAGGRTLGRALGCRALGWRWVTLFDVLTDPDGRTGRLLTGAREFASLDQQRRSRALRARRWSAATELAAGAWVVGAVSTWAVLIISGLMSRPGLGPIGGPWLSLGSGLPSFLALLVSSAAHAGERRLLGALAVRPRYQAVESDVAAWYAAAPGAWVPRPLLRSRARLASVLLQVGLAVMALTVSMVVIEAVVAASLAAKYSQRVGPRTVDVLATLDQPRDEDPVVRARLAMARYRPVSEVMGEDSAAALVRVLVTAADTPPGGGLVANPIPPTRLSALFRSAWAGTISADTLALIDAATSAPGLEAIRRLARARDVDLLVRGLDRPLDQYQVLRDVPFLRINTFRWAMRANILAALRDVARHDLAAADARIGENSALLEHFFHAPLWLYSVGATNSLQHNVLLPLAEIESIRGDTAAAAQLRALAPRQRLTTPDVRGLAVDPADLARLRAVLRDTLFTPGQRMQMVYRAGQGFCANPREFLSGPSRARHDAMLALADSMPGVAHARELVALAVNEWELPIPSAPYVMRWPFGVVIRVFQCIGSS